MTQTPPRIDERLEKVETVHIDFETYKKALKRNYLEDNNYHDRSFVLRLYPPFEAEMEADYYESVQGQHYNNDWDEKPYHITPELLILEGSDSSFRNIVEWPTEHNTRSALDDDVIEEEGMENLLEESREMFWDELKTILPDTYGIRQDLSKVYTVDLEWHFEDDVDE